MQSDCLINVHPSLNPDDGYQTPLGLCALIQSFLIKSLTKKIGIKTILSTRIKFVATQGIFLISTGLSKND